MEFIVGILIQIFFILFGKEERNTKKESIVPFFLFDDDMERYEKPAENTEDFNTKDEF